MSDPTDVASDNEEVARNDAQRARKPAGPLPMGHCYYCDEPLHDNYRRWCDAECRDAWEKESM